MKTRIQINLSVGAHAELKRRAEAAGMTRQAYVEEWLMRSIIEEAIERNDQEIASGFSPEARQAREEKKEARRARKAALQESVTKALPSVDKPEEIPSHFCSGALPKEGCTTCAGLKADLATAIKGAK